MYLAGGNFFARGFFCYSRWRVDHGSFLPFKTPSNLKVIISTSILYTEISRLIFFYLLGVLDDPDYTVLRFTTRSCNYYHGLANLTFEPKTSQDD